MKFEWISAEPGTEILMLGNRAVARGAIEAGVVIAAAYPGTPSSEIMESLLEASRILGFHAEWSINEKVAFDNVAGAAIIGARSICSMKTAGLNVASDTFFTLPYGGVKAGLVVVVADDPDAHYSSSEHDSRLLAIQAEIMCLEPSNSEEAKEMTRIAFDLSEESKLPVMVRMVSRVSHGSSNVILKPIRPIGQKLGFNKHFEMPYRWGVYGPPGTKYKHKWLHTRLPISKKQSDESTFNQLILNRSGISGIISSGIASSYTAEVIEELGLTSKINWLKIGVSYPPPFSKVQEVLNNSMSVLVIEDGYAFLEERVRLIAQEIESSTKIYGRQGRNPIFAEWGELTTDVVMAGVVKFVDLTSIPSDKERTALKKKANTMVVPRSSALCAGCPHLGTYWGLREAMKKEKGIPIINIDIGCYEQAGYGISSRERKGDFSESKRWSMKSLYEIADTCYVMGSSIGMAEGQSHAGYSNGKLIAIAGDSTFYHACLPALVNAVELKPKITFVVLDNKWTAMTGHQPSPTSGILGTGDPAQSIDIATVCQAIGIDNIYFADAFNVLSVQDAVENALASEQLAVIVITGECQIQSARLGKHSKFEVSYNDLDCDGCGTCIQLGCPAIGFDRHLRKATRDIILCVNCGLCTQICPQKAFSIRDAKDLK